MASSPIDVARQQQRLVKARRHIRVEASSFSVGGDGLVEEAAIAARVHEPREELGVVAMTLGLAEQPHQAALRLADVGFQVRVELVRHRETRTQRECAPERLLRPAVAVGLGLDVFSDQAMAAAQAGPRGSEPRIQLEAALVQVARAASRPS